VRVKTGGSARRPYADIRMRMGGPRAEIVYQVLNTILDGELAGGGVALVESMWAEIIGQSLVTGTVQRNARGKRKGDVRSRQLRGGTLTALEVRQHQRRQERRDDMQAGAEDRRVELLEGRGAGRDAAQRALTRTHDQWRRQSGGAAAFAASPARRAEDGMARAYRTGPRYRKAQAQARYRRRHRTR